MSPRLLCSSPQQMAKISIFILFNVFLFFNNAISDGTKCNINNYYDRTTNGCKLCPKCEAGKGYTDHCGYNETGFLKGPQCKSCRLGETYKVQESTGRCRPCRMCFGKVEAKSCTLTKNTVCANKCPTGKHNVDGKCLPIPTTVPGTSSVTTRITRVQPTTISGTSQLVRETESKLNVTRKPTTTVVSHSQEFKPKDATQVLNNESSEERFLKPGWVVFFCLMGSLFVTALVFLTCHRPTRKRISGFCRRNYRVLSSGQDVDRDITSDPLTAEGSYAEPAATREPDYATPIPSCEEPLGSPLVSSSSSSSDQVHHRLLETTEIDKEKMQCACTVPASDQPMDKMGDSSSSEELQLHMSGKRQRRQNPTVMCSPSPPTLGAPDQLISSWNGTATPRGVSPESHCVTFPSCSCSPGVTSRGRSLDWYYASSPSSTCETPSPPRGLSPNRCLGMSRSPSASPRMTPRGQSPDHLCMTSSTASPYVTPTRGRSPDPLPIPSIQVHSDSSEEQEISNQSKECSQIPMSIEACDKKHEMANAPRNINSSPAAPEKEITGQSTQRKTGLSPIKSPGCSCKRESDLTELNHCKEAASRARDARQVATSEKSADCVITHIGNEIKDGENGQLNIKTNVTISKCRYRPICRNKETEHRCRDCCPQLDDLFFPLIYKDRICLKEEICKELNRDGYKNLAIYSRVESEMKEYEASGNPAERVLDRLKASCPQLKLEAFLEMLLKIDRRDIVDVIHNHHISCNLCQKNSFDSKA